MDQRAKDLITISDGHFSRRLPILSLWQSTCEQFWPENADYTWVRSMGMEFASHLMTGVPVMASRDLANSISAMLRPPGQTWFHARTQSDHINTDTKCRVWLDWASEQMRQGMYDNASGWSRSSKEGDRGFVTIGNACLSLRPNEDFTGLLYRNHHMRDVAFAEDVSGKVNEVHVKRKITNINLCKLFPKTVPDMVKTAAERDPHGEVQCRHIVLPTDNYDAIGNRSKEEAAPGGDRRTNRRKLPFTSVWVCVDHDTILEEIGQWQLGYICPRWETVPGFGYGYSPPTVVNIADARMLQQITLTLLEAGQKAVDPPYKAVGQVIQGGVNAFAGGVTWVDAEYDERTGPALEPLLKTTPNLGWGVDREERIKKIIQDGHYLNQIRLPDTSHARTAFEVSKLWEEFIRNTTPLFEPIQSEYNGAVCDQTFEMILRMNGFGPVEMMPQLLRGQDIRFIFDSPLTLAATRANAQAFTQVGQLLQLAAAIDPAVRHDFDVDQGFRDAVIGSGAPAKWLVPREIADPLKAQDRQAADQAQSAQQMAGAVDQGATIATKIGQAATLLQQGGQMPQQVPQTGGLT